METSSLLLRRVVGERVHVARGGEGAVEVGEDVVCSERDELAPTEEDLAEEMVGIKGVGEEDDEATSSHASLLNLEHLRRAGR